MRVSGKWLLDLSMRKKLLAGFGLMLCITLLVVWISLSMYQAALSGLDSLLSVNRVSMVLNQARLHQLRFASSGERAELEAALQLSDKVLVHVESIVHQISNVDAQARMYDTRANVEAFRHQLLSLDQAMGARQAAQGKMEKTAVAALERFEVLRDALGDALRDAMTSGDGPLTSRLSEQLEQANSMAMELQSIRLAEKSYLLQQGTEVIEEYFALLENTAKFLIEEMPDEQHRQLVEQSLQELAHYRTQFLALRGSIDSQARSGVELNDRAQQVSQVSAELVDTQYTQLSEQARNAQWVLIAAAIVASVLGIVFALVVTQMIVSPLQRAVAVAGRIADGDLTEEIRETRNDELGRLMKAMAEMSSGLRALIGQLGQSVARLSDASDELSQVTTLTRSGVAEQRNEITQVSVAMDQMAMAVQEVARVAELAAISATEADKQTQASSVVVRQAVTGSQLLASNVEVSAESIRRLHQDSNRIGKVLDVIHSIAEQTNLLALNAAIEAARAGESGLGFAVVADEVRSLAHGTLKSAQEIQALIGQLQSGANAAVNNMDDCRYAANQTMQSSTEAGGALSLIDSAVSRIQQTSQQIATAAEEQSAVADDISSRLRNLQASADDSAHAADLTHDAGTALARLSEEMQALICRFRL